MTDAIITLEPVSAVLPAASAVGAIHTTNLRQALFFFAKLVLLDDSGQPAQVTITCGEVCLQVLGAHVGAIDRRLGFGDRAVHLNMPSVRPAYDALHRAGAGVIDELRAIGPDYAAFSIADREGHLIEISGPP
jgi:hypothetical protein